MTIGTLAAAVGWFAVFATAALLMGRSARHDWHEGRAENDGATMFYAVGQWWPTMLAATLAVVVPIVLVASSTT